MCYTQAREDRVLAEADAEFRELSSVLAKISASPVPKSDDVASSTIIGV